MNRIALATGSVLIVFALAMTVLAQEATSTDSVEALASTTAEQPIITEATTTISEAITASDSEVAVEATTTASSADETPLVLGASASTDAEPAVAATTTSATIVDIAATSAEPLRIAAQDIASFEDTYFKKNGKYLQIILGNQLADNESGTVAEKFGGNIPADARVDIYESPKGLGYQVTYKDSGTMYTVGYGPEAVERTYSRLLPIATSTAATTEPISI